MKTQTKTKFSLFAVLLAVLVMPLVFAFTACGNNDKATTLNNDMLTEYIQDGHESFVYTGSAITFENDKEDIAKILKEKIGEIKGLDQEYEIFYENNINVSKGQERASIIVKAKENATHIKGEARGYFLITKADNAKPTINNATSLSFNYGDKLAFSITEATEGTTFGADTVKYQYKTSEEGATWTDITKDTKLDAGTYKVKAVIAGTDNYAGVESDEAQFIVAQATNEWTVKPTVTNAQITYGGEIEVNMGEAKFGKVVVAYFNATKNGDTYAPTGTALDKKPTDAGNYVAEFTVTGNDNYTGLTLNVGFTIAQAGNTVTYDAPTDVVYTGSDLTASFEKTNLVEATNNKDEATFAFYSDANCQTSVTKIVDAGTYYVKVTVPATTNYKAETVTKAITVKQATNSWTTDGEPTVSDITFGGELTVNKGTPTFGAKTDVIVTYYNATKEGETYKMGQSLQSEPVNAGIYVAKFTVEGTTNYTQLSKAVGFTIAKANNNISAYTPATDKAVYTGSTITGLANIEFVTATYEGENGKRTFAFYDADQNPIATITNAGTYYVQVTIQGGTNYNDCTSGFLQFTIAQASNAKPTINETSFNYGDKLEFTSTGATFGADTVKYQYKTSADGATWTDITEDTKLDAGTYKVKAVIAETNNYAGVETEAEFTIAKAENDISAITPLTFVYGNELKFTSTATSGTATYEYVVAEDETLPTELTGWTAITSTTKPNVGTYWVKASVAESKNYESAVAYQQFTITEASNAVTYKAPTDVAYTGTDLADSFAKTSLVGATNNQASATFKFYSNEECTQGVDEIVNAGTYYVKVTVPAEGNYAEGTVTKAITVKQATNSWTTNPTVSNITYGGELTVNKGTPTFGTATVAYLNATKKGDTYTPTGQAFAEAPVNAGNYVAVFIVEETTNYTKLSEIIGFTIAQATNSWTTNPTVSDITYGGELTVNKGTPTFGTATVAYFNATKDAEGEYEKGTELTEAPVNAGTYVAVFAVEGTSNYTGLTLNVGFTIAKAENDISAITPSTFVYGDELTFTSTAISGEATYEYAKVIGDESQPDTMTAWMTIPTTSIDAGTYWVKASVAESKNYESAVAYQKFEVKQGTASVASVADLQSAINNANYSTIKLTNNVDLGTTQITIPRTLTLDLNGNKIKSTYDPADENAIKSAIAVTTKDVVLTVTGNGTIEATQTTIRANNGAKLVIENGTFTSSAGNGVATNAGEIEITTATITANATDTAAVAVFNGGKLTITDGTFYGNNDGVVQTNGLAEWAGSTIDINGGTFIGKISENTTTAKNRVASGLYVANKDTVTVDNAIFKIENGVGIVARCGTTTIGKDVTFTLTTTENGPKTGYVGDSKAVEFTAGEAIVVDYVSNYPGETPTVTNNSEGNVVAYVRDTTSLANVASGIKTIILSPAEATTFTLPDTVSATKIIVRANATVTGVPGDKTSLFKAESGYEIVQTEVSTETSRTYTITVQVATE